MEHVQQTPFTYFNKGFTMNEAAMELVTAGNIISHPI